MSDARWFEPLEARVMLSVSPEALLAEGFEVIQWQGQEAYAKPGQWIVKLSNVRGSAAEQLQVVNERLQRVQPQAQATRHLGQNGLVLVQTADDVGYEQLRAALVGLGSFRYVEPDFALWVDATPDDTSFSSLWGLHNSGQTGGTVDADIDAPEAWDIAAGAGQIVGVIDTGIDYNHPDLAANVWVNPGETAGDGIDNDGNGYVDDLHGWDFINNDNNPMDDNGHGTHVAGTIAAVGNNAAGVVGVAYDAKVMALKFLGANGSGSTSGAVAAINYATNLRKNHDIDIRLTNNSWSGGGYSTSLYNAIKASGDAGMLFVAAAGNGGSDRKGDNNDTTPTYPASYNLGNVLAVAATDHNDNLASFSNYGATSVDLAAPGVSIRSTTPGNSYANYSGTSMASPHVAGALAMIWSHAPAASAATIRSAILSGVDVKGQLNGKVASNGRLNASGALQQLNVTPPTPTAPAAPSNLQAQAVSSSRINLTWADNAGNEDGYRVYRASDGVNFSLVATLGSNATSYADTGLSEQTTYSYLVRAYNAVGESGDSNLASATTPQQVALPAVPSNLTAVALSASQIALSWQDNASNEDGFYVERSTNGKSWSRVATLGANTSSYTDSNLRKRTSYQYRVAAFNSAGIEGYSNIATAVTANANSLASLIAWLDRQGND